ncbi:MAG: PaaI family thioesterase [Promethearchaeota archaeon]
MENEAIQDKWPEIGTYCWGCGRSNEHGLQIKSYWEGDECVCTWKPKRYYCAYPGRGCGGILATILDCHCLNTAASAAHRAEGREEGTDPPIMYATGTLSVKFLNPAPLNKPWIFRARVKEMSERKITVSCSVFAKEKECANGEIVAIRMRI